MSDESILYEFTRFCMHVRCEMLSESRFTNLVIKHVKRECADETPEQSMEAMFVDMLTKPDNAESVVNVLGSTAPLMPGAKHICDKFRKSRLIADKEIQLWCTCALAARLPFEGEPLSRALSTLRLLGSPYCVNLEFWRGTVPFESYHHARPDGDKIEDILNSAKEDIEDEFFDRVFVYDDLFAWVFPTTLWVESDGPLFRHPLYPHEVYWMRHDRIVRDRVLRAWFYLRMYFGIIGSTVLATRSREWGLNRAELSRSVARLRRAFNFLKLMGFDEQCAEIVASLANASSKDAVCATALVQEFGEYLDVGSPVCRESDDDESSDAQSDHAVAGDNGDNEEDDEEGGDDSNRYTRVGVRPTRPPARSGMAQRRHTDPTSDDFSKEPSD